MAETYVSEWDGVDNSVVNLQKLEEKAQKAQEAFEKEEKLRKELEVLNAKLLEEKTSLLANLEGEKGSLSEFQERANKLQAQKNDLEAQLRVSCNWSTRITSNKFSNKRQNTTEGLYCESDRNFWWLRPCSFLKAWNKYIIDSVVIF